MTASVAEETSPDDRHWYIVTRWQEYDGEARANLIRIVSIGLFYIVEFLHYYCFLDAAGRSDSLRFHQGVTALAVAWTMVALGVLLCLRGQVFPATLKYISTCCDVVLLTSMASIGNGPHSPLVLVYFLIIGLATLRFSLTLIWCTTIATMIGYIATVGLSDRTWFNSEHTVSPVEQMVVLLSLALTGMVLGQVIRRFRIMADEFARRERQ